MSLYGYFLLSTVTQDAENIETSTLTLCVTSKASNTSYTSVPILYKKKFKKMNNPVDFTKMTWYHARGFTKMKSLAKVPFREFM